MMTKKKPRTYAVVDLEATSAGHQAKIIQVGIVLIENNHITKTYQTDVNPHEPLDEHIIDLTGLTDKRLRQAPDFSQVAAEIYELLKDCIFVAHNVKFDANLLAEELFFAGFELKTPRVDTVELSQIFFPTFEKYTLSQLALELDLDLKDAHTALADAYATAQLFLKLKEKISQLPKITLEMILTYRESLLFESDLVIDEVFQQVSTHLRKDFVEINGIILKKQAHIVQERKFSKDFVTNLALLQLEERSAQFDFANHVSEGLSDLKPSLIEADSGIGKTYGYLLPCLSLTDKSMVVSVPTKALQDQIMANEAKRLAEVFHLRSHSLKSAKNYIKLDAFYQSLQTQDKNRLINRYKMQLLVWLVDTKTGDLDEIKQKQSLSTYFDELRHDGQMSEQSLFQDVDFWKLSIEESKQSRLLITNHAYLLERVQDDSHFLDDKILVVDEAQNLVLAVEEQSRQRLNVKSALLWLDKTLKQTNRLLDRRLLEEIQFQLSHTVENFYQKQMTELAGDDLLRLRQSILELPHPIDEALLKIAQPHFSDYWFESENILNERRTYLVAAKSDLIDFASLIPETTKVYLISATLAISKNISLPEILGFSHLPYVSVSSQQVSNQTIWVDQTMPVVTDLSDKDYEEEILMRLLTVATLEKPVLVLFTANHLMLGVSERLDKLGVRHLCQHKNGTASQVKKRFDRGDSLILLGTGSFWEGMDFTVQDEMIVLVTRLPFFNPKDRFFKKISHYLKDNGQNPFYAYALPLAGLKLKQAIGRTTRRENQFSSVIILDNRILNKAYGRQIQTILGKQNPLHIQKFPKIIKEITQFFGIIEHNDTKRER